MIRRTMEIGLCFLLMAVAACDTANMQEDFVGEAGAPPSNYTRTDSNGGVLSEDEDDWRTAPVYVGKIRIGPAFPNPVSTADFAFILVSILDFDVSPGRLLLRGRDASGIFLELGRIESVNAPGDYSFSFTPALLGRTRLNRVFIFDGAGELVSYGDILIQ